MVNMHAKTPTLKFSLILATVDRSDADLSRLFDSLRRQTHRTFEVIIVDQNTDARVANILANFQGCFGYTHLTSDRGLSKARNKGLEHATGEVLAFPDDDCWYDPDLLATVARLLRAHPEWDGITGSSTAGAWGRTAGRITRGNAWSRGISFSMFLRRNRVAGNRFDETLGVGAGTPWGSGEETDYLLQALEAGLVVHYRPEVKVNHPPWDFSAGSNSKARAYGRGMGRWLKKHRFGPHEVAYHVARPLAASAIAFLRGDREKASYRWATCIGRFEGWVKDL